MNTLEQILDCVNYLGLSHGDLLANYKTARCRRMMDFKHQHDTINTPKEFQEIINKSAYLDVLDHYSRIILSNYYEVQHEMSNM